MRTLAALILIVSLLAIPFAYPVFGGQYEDAISAYKRGEYRTAFRLTKPLAEQGNAKAQYNLGVMFEKGQGVPRNPTEAAKWYRRASEQGFAYAQNNLAFLYANGQGVPQDYKEAVKWFRKAAEQGNAKTQYNLGVMYANGQGVPRNSTEAAKWYRRASKQGHAKAQYNLGLMYFKGESIPQDYIRAHMWFSLAVSRFPASEVELQKKALKGRDIAASKMTPAQIAEAQRLAREWKPKKEGK